MRFTCFQSRRAFFVPAVMIGLLYGSVALVRPLGLHGSLVTTRLMFEWWYSGNKSDINQYVIGTNFADADVTGEVVYSILTNPVTEMYGPNQTILDEFGVIQRIGHCAVALSLAVIAGLVGSYVARKRQVKVE